MVEKIDENGNIINNEDLENQVKKWLDHCHKTLDFVYDQELRIPQLNVLEALQGLAQMKICDPYGYIEEPPLCNKIESIESHNGKLYKPGENSCGKLCVRLNTGEELLGRWVDGGRQGQGTIVSPRLEKLGVSSIVGNYEDGILTGRGKLIMTDGSMREGWFQHGYFHGPARGCVGVAEVNFIGHYRAGLKHGVTWTKLTGGGWLVGHVDANGEYTGADIAFLYPDMKTALVGEFCQGVMIKARPARLCKIVVKEEVLCPLFDILSDREYSYSPSTKDEIKIPLHWRDPYEEQWLEVKESKISGGGEGAFSIRDIPANTVIAYYNGIRMSQNEKSPCEDTGYAIWVEFQKKSQFSKKVGDHMDLPPEFHSYSQYSSTSAHKLNHSFKPNCTWSNAQHPSYGFVPSVVTIEPVVAGEELTIHYMMDMEDAPDWYKDAWDQHSV